MSEALSRIIPGFPELATKAPSWEQKIKYHTFSVEKTQQLRLAISSSWQGWLQTYTHPITLKKKPIDHYKRMTENE